MNEEERIRRLAARARMEAAPRVDVADRVMAVVLAGARPRVADMRPLAWVAGVSAAVAVPLTVLALGAWEALTDPLLIALVELPWGLL